MAAVTIYGQIIVDRIKMPTLIPEMYALLGLRILPRNIQLITISVIAAAAIAANIDQ